MNVVKFRLILVIVFSFPDLILQIEREWKGV